LAPGRRQRLEAEELSALRRSAVRRLADQRAVARPESVSVRRPRREAVSFRRPAACPGAGQGAVAARPEVSSSRHLRREAVVYRAARSVRRRREASSKAFRPEARLSEVPLSEALRSAGLLWWTAFPPVLLPAFPARA